MSILNTNSPETKTSTDSSQVTQTVSEGGIAANTRGKNAVTVFGDYFKVTKGGSINLSQTVSPNGADGSSSYLADSIFGQGAGGGGAGAATTSGFSWSPMTLGIIGAVLLGVFFLLKRK